MVKSEPAEVCEGLSCGKEGMIKAGQIWRPNSKIRVH